MRLPATQAADTAATAASATVTAATVTAAPARSAGDPENAATHKAPNGESTAKSASATPASTSNSGESKSPTDAPVIPLPNLALATLPVLVVLAVLWRWGLEVGAGFLAFLRMLAQLLLVGYVLATIFETDQSLVVVGVLSVMLLAASLIAIRTVSEDRNAAWRRAVLAILIGGVPTLFLVTAGVLRIDPWYQPRKLVPLAGMIFANAMNSVSLAAERFASERTNGHDVESARRTALRTSLIPITNSFLAVGIVSFPGMMTGQILSGVDPLVAVRYQIVVMCMVFGAAGVASACYLGQLDSGEIAAQGATAPNPMDNTPVKPPHDAEPGDERPHDEQQDAHEG